MVQALNHYSYKICSVFMQVKVANGYKICSVGTCKEFVPIKGPKFKVPFHVLTLGGSDIVLGV